MRIPKRGEKGFTLIELLIVVAILGVLAAVVIPNVQRFMGAGTEEAAATELANIQTAVTAMMVDNGLSELPVPVGTSTNDMSAFPDATSSDVLPTADHPGKVTDPEGVDYDYTTAGDLEGYILYQHDIKGDDGAVDLVNYVAAQLTSKYYTIDASGTVHQHEAEGEAAP